MRPEVLGGEPSADGHPVAPSPAADGLSITVELVTGRGRDWWPRPGRVFAASAGHTFAELAVAIDVAFGRWDLDHLRMFVLSDGTQLSWSTWRAGPVFRGSIDGRTLHLDTLRPGDRLAYVFDLGQDWTHLCTVGPADHGVVPPLPPTPPRPVRGWGGVPDQFGRQWPDDPVQAPSGRCSTAMLADLPPILPAWATARGSAPRS